MPQLRFLQLPWQWLPVKLRYYEPNFKALLYQTLAHVSPCEILNWLNPSTLILPQRKAKELSLWATIACRTGTREQSKTFVRELPILLCDMIPLQGIWSRGIWGLSTMSALHCVAVHHLQCQRINQNTFSCMQLGLVYSNSGTRREGIAHAFVNLRSRFTSDPGPNS